MTSRRTCRQPVPALEDDDLLYEILLRLPPQPSFLLRASLVCKRWRRLATDSHFLRRFRLHHRSPLLLGVFMHDDETFSFRSTLDPPYRISPERFSLRLDNSQGWRLSDCRHGRVLFINRGMRQFIVWNPITDDRCLVVVPSEFHRIHTGAVLCAIDDQGHDHGGCHSSPFKVALLGANKHGNQTVVSVYSTETSIWGDLISRELPCMYKNSYISSPSALVGNTLYWWTGIGWWFRYRILAFDLGRQCLAGIEKPSEIEKPPPCFNHDQSVYIIQAKDGCLGFVALWCADRNKTYLKMWDRKVSYSGVNTWVLSKSITLQRILGKYKGMPRILRYVEDVHAIFIRVGSSIFMVQLESMQSKELLKTGYSGIYHLFTSFYTEESDVIKMVLPSSFTAVVGLPSPWLTICILASTGLLVWYGHALFSVERAVAAASRFYQHERQVLPWQSPWTG